MVINTNIGTLRVSLLRKGTRSCNQSMLWFHGEFHLEMVMLVPCCGVALSVALARG